MMPPVTSKMIKKFTENPDIDNKIKIKDSIKKFNSSINLQAN